MASLHRDPDRSPFWYCSYRTADGKQHHKSTRTTSKAEAKAICDKLGKVAQLSRKARLTPDRARQLIEAAVMEVLEESGQTLPNSTIGDYFKSWLKEKEDAGAVSTYDRYDGIVRKFLDYLGERCEDSLASLTKADILAFRDDLADNVSGGTVNTYLKVLRVALGRAVKEQIIEKNPAALVDRVSTRDRHERRAFTIPELQKLLAAARESDSPPGQWSTMLMIGIYTGLRLQDAASLTWENLDLKAREITVTTSKTGRTVILPIAKALMRHIERLPAGDDPKSALCPDLDGKSSSWLSNSFFALMASAGLVSARDHQGAEEKLKAAREKYQREATPANRAAVELLERKRKGRDKRRELNAIGFHSLRHTATSLLKNAGVSDVVARDLIGHESAAISRNYTHVDQKAKRTAVDKMADVHDPVHQFQLGL